MPGIGIGLGYRPDGADHAGVVEHHVQLPHVSISRSTAATICFLFGDVALHEPGRSPSLSAIALPEFILDVSHYDPVPSSTNRSRARRADTTGMPR